MGKRRVNQDLPEGGLAALFAQSQPQEQNPFQTGTSGWSEWQQERGLPTTNVIDPNTGRGIDASGNYTYGNPELDAYARSLKKDDLWRFQKMEEHMAGKGLESLNSGTGDIFASFTGPLEFLRNAGVSNKKLGGGDEANLIRELTELGNRGIQFGNTAMKNPGQISRMAPDLARWGVKSLNDLQAFDIPGRGTLYYNKGNNTVLPSDFGSSMHGEGGTYFNLANINGHVIPKTEWTNTSDKQSIMGALTVLGAAAGLGGLGGVIGGAIAPAGTTAAGTSAIGNAALGAGMGALKGGVTGGWAGAGLGALTGGLGGAVSYANPAGYMGINDPTVQAAINSAISGGLKSGITGGDISQGALSGGFSGAMGQQFGTLGSMAGGALANMAFQGNQQAPANRYTSGNNPTYQTPTVQTPTTTSPGMSLQDRFNNVYNQVQNSAAPGKDRLLANLNFVGQRIV